MAGAALTPTNDSTNVHVRAKSNQGGNYQLLFLMARRYNVTTNGKQGGF